MAIYQNGSLQEQTIYGSSRLGIYQGQGTQGKRSVGFKEYEISNHLGNVIATVSDLRFTTALVSSQSDYRPFGQVLKERTWQSGEYSFGFNGKENDKASNWQDYGMRYYMGASTSEDNYEPLRFPNVDPLTKKYPWYTPYQFAGNKPIWAVDLDGAEELPYQSIKDGWNKGGIVGIGAVGIFNTFAFSINMVHSAGSAVAKGTVATLNLGSAVTSTISNVNSGEYYQTTFPVIDQNFKLTYVTHAQYQFSSYMQNDVQQIIQTTVVAASLAPIGRGTSYVPQVIKKSTELTALQWGKGIFQSFDWKKSTQSVGIEFLQQYALYNGELSKMDRADIIFKFARLNPYADIAAGTLFDWKGRGIVGDATTIFGKTSYEIEGDIFSKYSSARTSKFLDNIVPFGQANAGYIFNSGVKLSFGFQFKAAKNIYVESNKAQTNTNTSSKTN